MPGGAKRSLVGVDGGDEVGWLRDCKVRVVVVELGPPLDLSSDVVVVVVEVVSPFIAGAKMTEEVERVGEPKRALRMARAAKTGAGVSGASSWAVASRTNVSVVFVVCVCERVCERMRECVHMVRLYTHIQDH